MLRTLLVLFILFRGLFVRAQVGIGTVTPDSKLEIRSAGSSATTRSFHVKTPAGVTLFLVRDDGHLGIGTNNPGAALDISGALLDIKGVLLLSGSSAGYVGLSSPSSGDSVIYTLPGVDGVSGQVLSTNGNGQLSWTSAGSGTAVVKAKSRSALLSNVERYDITVPNLDVNDGISVIMEVDLAPKPIPNYYIFRDIGGGKVTVHFTAPYSGYITWLIIE